MSFELGRALGNWNDRRNNHDSRGEVTRFYRVLDRISSWLYVRAI